MGGYRHVQFLSKDVITGALEVNFFLRAANILSFASGKAAVDSLILRLMGRFNQWQRCVVWVVIVLTAIINILNCIFNFVQCHPIKANWNPEVPHSCWPPQAQLDFAYFMSSVSNDLICPYMHVSFLSFLFADFGESTSMTIGENIMADVILAILPATIFWNLNVSTERRIYLSVVLGLGSM